MTTPDETATDVIADELDGLQEDPEWLAQKALAALTAAGFAVVRLPEPDRVDAAGGAVWEVGDSTVYSDPDGPVLNLTHSPVAGEPSQLAAALLAAADRQEKNQ